MKIKFKPFKYSIILRNPERFFYKKFNKSINGKIVQIYCNNNGDRYALDIINRNSKISRFFHRVNNNIWASIYEVIEGHLREKYENKI